MGCDAVILLDTHVLIWLDEGSDRLGARARKLIDATFREESLAVSAMTWWEAAMLQSKGRVELPPVRGWYRDLMDAGLMEIPMDGETGMVSVELEGFHGDPADRIIVATAMLRGATLMTADEKILGWSGLLDRCDARQ